MHNYILKEIEHICNKSNGMQNDQDKIEILLGKLEVLLKKQESFSDEIDMLRKEIVQFHMGHREENEVVSDELVPEISQQEVSPFIEESSTISESRQPQSTFQKQPAPYVKPQKPAAKVINFEKLIGENLINKIGIAITVLGVAIGAKYSIDNNLISPMTRIILGYLMGIALLGFGIKLKNNYHNYSAVLVSGAIAILYFITYAAYSFYHIFPIGLAFALMVIFTAFSVLAAIHYDKQVIAHIGLVGAYAVPFLLSEGSGNVAVLFTYMSIINIGILVIAFKKHWKPLYYAAFVFSWMIYLSWYSFDFKDQLHFNLALVFLLVIFITFYLVFLAYKLVKKEKFAAKDIVFVLINSFIFYGVGYTLLDGHFPQNQWAGLFTLANAGIHFIAAFTIFRLNLADKSLFYFLTGMVLTFITIAIPVQLEGSWVTLIWVFEAALLFWIGRTKSNPSFEKMSYPLMMLSVFSLMLDWKQYKSDVYLVSEKLLPIVNNYFMTGVLFLLCFCFIYYIHKKNYSAITLSGFKNWYNNLSSILAVSIVILLYLTFLMELTAYWDRTYTASMIEDGDRGTIYNYDLNAYNLLWTLIYSLTYLSGLIWFIMKKVKNTFGGYVVFGFLVWFISLSSTEGLTNLANLRNSYLNTDIQTIYETSIFHLLIRYILMAITGLGLFSLYQLLMQEFMRAPTWLRIAFDVFLSGILLIWISSELVVWMDINRNTESSKLAMSILWGIFALILISYGFWKNKKHIRLLAISLFSLTLIKVFFYDIADMSTIAKTVIFIILGILLLITSFLYNKFNSITSKENEKE